MRRTVSAVLAVIMLFSIVFAVASYRSTYAIGDTNRKLTVSNLKANCADVVVGEHRIVNFSADVRLDSALFTRKIALFDGEKTIAYLYDDGKNGDELRGDGRYSADVELFSTERKTVEYSVITDGENVCSCEIVFYTPATAKDMSVHDSLWSSIDAKEKIMENRKIDDSVILDSMFEYVSASSDVKSVTWENEYSFSFILDSGITNVYARWNMQSRGSSETDSVFDEITERNGLIKGSDEFATWDDPDFVCFRPFRNSPYEGDFENEFYTGIAEDVCEITGGTVTDFVESEAYPGNLLHVDEYGFFIIDSHGTTASGKSYMIMRRGDTSKYEYSEDLSAGHLISLGSDVGVTGSFFTKYYERDLKTLPGTMFYLVTCLGMATTAICNPVIELGAKLVVGYDESVSFTYDFEISEVVWGCLVTPFPDDPSRTYTITEAIAEGKEQCGDPDPYSSSAASMQFAGAGNFVLSHEPVPIVSVTLDPDSVELYINNPIQISVMTDPIDANKYTCVWTSNNESVAIVSDKGIVTAVDTGEAVITCSITDNAGETPNSFEATCNVKVIGSLDVTGLDVISKEMTLYTDTEATPIQANVIPENASNNTILYSSSDSSIVTVDELGMVTAVSEGVAIISLETQDGGFTDYVICRVYSGDLNGAVNCNGGALEFSAFGTYRWAPVLKDSRLAAVSGNAGHENTNSALTYNAGTLAEGVTLSFSWKVSSEEGYDYLVFRVNGQEVSGIHKLTGETGWIDSEYTTTASRSYSFTWTYEKDVYVDKGDDCGWVDNVDINYDGLQHSVTFMNGDEVVSEQTVTHGEAAQEPQEPTAAGKVFVCWDREFEEVRSDMTIHGVFIDSDEPTPTPTPEPTPTPVPTYTVTFVDWDGTVIAEEVVEEGSGATAPVNPVRDGYVFIGWDKDYSVVVENMTITAQYAMAGDANGDSIINTGDATTVLRYAVDLIQFDDMQLLSADINGDGTVNTGDAVMILMVVVES